MVVIMGGTILGVGTDGTVGTVGTVGDMAVSVTDMQVTDTDGTILTMDMVMETETITVIMDMQIEITLSTTLEEEIIQEYQPTITQLRYGEGQT